MLGKAYINRKGIVVEAFIMDPRAVLPSWVRREWIGTDRDGVPCLLIPTKAQRTMCVRLGRVLTRRVVDGHLCHVSQAVFFQSFIEYLR